MLAHFEETLDDPPSSISMSLPGVPEEFGWSYSWGDGGEEGKGEVEPFVSLVEQ